LAQKLLDIPLRPISGPPETTMEPIPQSRGADPESTFRHLRIVHAAMAGAVLTYGLLVLLMLSRDLVPREGFVGSLPFLRILLWLAAFGNVGVIGRIRAQFLTPQALRQRARPVAQSIATWHIIMFALADAIAIYGLLLYLLSGLLHDFVVLSGLSLAILFWLRPTEQGYRALLRQTSGS
jgi:F0F1-type ATP synthase membrane subunit c/vacuolar-type H+-ATPase subunit K